MGTQWPRATATKFINRFNPCNWFVLTLNTHNDTLVLTTVFFLVSQTGEILKELDCSPYLVQCLHVTSVEEREDILYTGGACKKLMLFKPQVKTLQPYLNTILNNSVLDIML